jgi:ABC-type uncharacterized transport system substrate-binding protein
MQMAILLSVAVAFLSGVSFLAYKHPHAFFHLGVALLIFATALFVGAAVWDMSNSLTFTAIYQYLKDDAETRAAARVASDGIRVFTLPVLVAFMILSAYIAFLTFFLPDLLKQNRHGPD